LAKLILIVYKDIAGYDIYNLQDWLKEHGKLDEWNYWSIGNTGMITDTGIFMVYKSDVDAFLSGGKNYD
jgi:hypothetical protein